MRAVVNVINLVWCPGGHRCFLETLSYLLSFTGNPLAYLLGRPRQAITEKQEEAIVWSWSCFFCILFMQLVEECKWQKYKKKTSMSSAHLYRQLWELRWKSNMLWCCFQDSKVTQTLNSPSAQVVGLILTYESWLSESRSGSPPATLEGDILMKHESFGMPPKLVW